MFALKAGLSIAAALLRSRANQFIPWKSTPPPIKPGLALLEKLHGGEAGEQLVASLKDICPDFATMTIDWALGGIMARPGLDLLTREFLLIAACTTLGHAVPQLRAHLASARKLGATREQIVEVILQMTFYAGGAATSNALRLAQEVLAESSRT